jgi:putative effector of murein hydrolase LrgA (UPF0299 family)
MIDTNNPLVQIKITESVCAFVAICTTVYRLYIRRGRLWIDDAWAMFALVTLFAQIGAVFMHVQNPADISKTSRVAAYYLMAITFYCIIWASRISIIFSIIRIDPNPDRRKLYVGVSAVYFITVVVLIVQLFWVCEPEPSWKDAASPQCTLNKQVAISQLVTDILADMFLLFAPLRVFMHLSDKALRRKLIIIFSTCIITTIVSLVHAAYILSVGGIKVIISALVEDCVSLMIANVPVVVTAVMRFGADQDKKPPPTKSMLSTAMHFASRKFGIHNKSQAANGATTTTGSGVVSGFRFGFGSGKKGDSEASTATLTNGSSSYGLFSTNGVGLGTVGVVGTRGGIPDGNSDPIMLDLLETRKDSAKGGERDEEEVESSKRTVEWADATKAV